MIMRTDSSVSRALHPLWKILALCSFAGPSSQRKPGNRGVFLRIRTRPYLCSCVPVLCHLPLPKTGSNTQEWKYVRMVKIPTCRSCPAPNITDTSAVSLPNETNPIIPSAQSSSLEVSKSFQDPMYDLCVDPELLKAPKSTSRDIPFRIQSSVSHLGDTALHSFSPCASCITFPKPPFFILCIHSLPDLHQERA